MERFGCGSRGQSRGRRLRRWRLLRGWRWRLRASGVGDVRLQLVVAVVEEAHARVKEPALALHVRAVLATTLNKLRYLSVKESFPTVQVARLRRRL